LDREDFLRIPELAINPLGDRIVDAFFTDHGVNDPETDARINFRQFVKVLAHFRPMSKSKPNIVNSREQKLKCKIFLNFLWIFFSFQSCLFNV